MDDLYSLLPATKVPVSSFPKIGSKAPELDDISKSTGKPILVAFLRHVGCPFAEVTMRQLSSIARKHPKLQVIAVSHASDRDTHKWIKDMDLSSNKDVQIIINQDRTLYGKWGLDTTWALHAFGWSSLSSVAKLAWQEGIYNRPTKGTRWQRAGFFGIDEDGIVRFASKSETANDIPDLESSASTLLSSKSRL